MFKSIVEKPIKWFMENCDIHDKQRTLAAMFFQRWNIFLAMFVGRGGGGGEGGHLVTISVK